MEEEVDSIVRSGWAALALAWLFFIVPIPLLSTLCGSVVAFGGLLIAILVIAKGRVGAGFAQLAANVVLSPVVYFLGIRVYGLLTP